MENVVEEWFGEAFRQLHPLLQRLHRSGGVLSGQVQVSFGQGPAGFLGKRLAARLGVPGVAGAHHLQVAIHSQAGTLHWARTFDHLDKFSSEFRPVGHFPAGHWVERSGALSLELGVTILAGGWHWEHQGTRVFGIPVPKALFPTTVAFKSIEGALYRFSVEVRAPVLGMLLGYSGTLAPEPSIERDVQGLAPSAAPDVRY